MLSVGGRLGGVTEIVYPAYDEKCLTGRVRFDDKLGGMGCQENLGFRPLNSHFYPCGLTAAVGATAIIVQVRLIDDRNHLMMVET